MPLRLPASLAGLPASLAGLPASLARLTASLARLGVLLIWLSAPLACGPADDSEPAAGSTALVPAERHDAMFVSRVREMASLEGRESVELLFLGDSITQGWEEEGRYVWNAEYAPRGAANFGIDGDRTQHVLWRLRSGAVDGLSPKLVVLLIGTNNSESNTPEEVVEGVAAILLELRARLPKARVLLLALFPKHPRPESGARRRVVAINALLPALADGEWVHFLDVGGIFLAPDGQLERALMPDALHPSAIGYKRWSEAMEPTLSALLRDD